MSSTSDTIKQLRLPLIILVTYAHSYGYVTEGYSLLSGWDTYEVLKLLISQTIVKVAMPTFFVMSGYLFFANVTEWNVHIYWGKIKRRIQTLLVPYLVWNLLMAVKLKTFNWTVFWVFWSKAGVQTDWLGHEQLMTAPANMPLWFLRDLIVVSLFTPIIYIGIKRFGYWLIGLLTILYLSGICAFIPGLSAYAIYFFVLGAFLSIRKMDLTDTFMKYERGAYLLTVSLAITMMATYQTAVFSSFMLCFRLTGVVAVFCLANRILSMTSLRIPQVACDSSYFIYLAHYVFFLSFIDTAFFSICGYSTWSLVTHYLFCPILKITCFVIVYYIYRRIR